ncbi:MAG TPA: calcium-binding protein, partial [Phytomonospora sp.]
MATYHFSTITTAQATTYDAAADDLQFTAVDGARATNILVTGAYTLRIISTNVNLTLSPAAQGEVLEMPDGSKLSLPSVSPVALSGGVAGDHLYGSDGTDLLFGQAGDDQLEARGGADTLTGGTGADTLTGGGGQDVYVFAAGDSSASVSRADVITDWTSAARIQFSGGMRVPYIETTANPVTAATIANQAIAAGAADVVAVQAGFDVIIFTDTKNDDGNADDIILLPGRNLDDISAANVLGLTGGAGGDGLRGGPGDDGLLGTSNGERVSGEDGADTLDAGPGDDTLDGGTGADVLVGGEGDDLMVGGEGVDRASYFVGPGGVAVDLGAGTAVGVGLDRLVGVEDVDGSAGDDILQGDAGVNALRGFAGVDSLNGRAGDDTLDGGQGDDIVTGGAGQDFLRGGGGSDMFVFAPGDTALDAPDVILDYVGAGATPDKLAFGTGTGSYTEITAADYAIALDWAHVAAASGIRYIAAQVGTSVYVFGDSAGDGGGVENAVRIDNLTLSAISAQNIVGATSTVTAPPPPI